MNNLGNLPQSERAQSEMREFLADAIDNEMKAGIAKVDITSLKQKDRLKVPTHPYMAQGKNSSISPLSNPYSTSNKDARFKRSSSNA